MKLLKRFRSARERGAGQVKLHEVYTSPSPRFMKGNKYMQMDELVQILFGSTDGVHTICLISMECMLVHRDLVFSSEFADIVDENGQFSCLFLQTWIAYAMQQGSRTQEHGILKYLRNSIERNNASQIILFDELLRLDVKSIRNESLFTIDALYEVAVWFKQYFDEKLNIKLICTRNEINSLRTSFLDNISAISFSDFIKVISPVNRVDTFLQIINEHFENNEDCEEVYEMKESVFPAHVSLSRALEGIKDGSLLTGEIDVLRKDREKAEVKLKGKHTYDIVLIPSLYHRNRAMHGDSVAIKLLPKSEWLEVPISALQDESDDEVQYESSSDGSDDDVEDECLPSTNPKRRSTIKSGGFKTVPSAAVVYIFKRGYSRVVGRVEMNGSELKLDENAVLRDPPRYVMVKPFETRLPKIRIRTKLWRTLSSASEAVIVDIDYWKPVSKYPFGHIVKRLSMENPDSIVQCSSIEESIGNNSNVLLQVSLIPQVKVMLETVLHKCSIDYTQFSDRVIAEVAVLDKVSDKTLGYPSALPAIYAREHKGCRDFRQSHVVFSVDPIGCQDIDDTMSVNVTKRIIQSKTVQFEVEVGVHIADVCSMVQQGGALDDVASDRGTTVYLPHKRIDMLPSTISSDLASLHQDVDRRTVSTVWIIVIECDVSDVESDKDDIFDTVMNRLILLHETGKVKLRCRGGGDLSLIENLAKLPSYLGRSVIRNRASMTYEQASALLLVPVDRLCVDRNDDLGIPFTVTPGQAGQRIDPSLRKKLFQDLQILTIFGRELMLCREQSGALKLTRESGGQLQFYMYSGGDELKDAVSDHKHCEIHDTIAELMILSNSTVATFNYQCAPSSTLLRIHPLPTESKLEYLRGIIEESGLEKALSAAMKVDNWQNPQTILKFVLNYKEYIRSISKVHKLSAEVMEFITFSVIRAMSGAKYVCSGNLTGDLFARTEHTEVSSGDTQLLGHFGLGIKLYTHFTSPIRRFADVVVHRQLIYNLSRTPIRDPNVPILTEQLSVCDISTTDNEIGDTGDSVLEIGADDGLDDLLSSVNAGVDLNNGADDGLDDLLSSVNAGVDLNNGADDGLDDLLSSVCAGTSSNSIIPSKDFDFIDQLLEISAPTCVRSSDCKENAEKLTNGMLNTDRSDGNEKDTSPYSSAKISILTEKLNMRNENSKLAQLECQKTFLYVYFLRQVLKRSSESMCFNGIVIKLLEYSVVVFVPQFDLKLPLYFDRLYEDPVTSGVYGKKHVFGSSNCVEIEGQYGSNYCFYKEFGCRLITNAQGEEVFCVGPRSVSSVDVFESKQFLKLKNFQNVTVSITPQCTRSGHWDWFNGRLKLHFESAHGCDTVSRPTSASEPAYSSASSTSTVNTADIFSNNYSGKPCLQESLYQVGKQQRIMPPISFKKPPKSDFFLLKIKNTTRIAVGKLPAMSDAEEKGSEQPHVAQVPIKYLIYAHDIHPVSGSKTNLNNGYRNFNAVNEQFALKSASSGRDSARAKLTQLGISWDEEELPDGGYDNYGDEMTVSNKELRSINARQDKLKVKKFQSRTKS